MSFLDDLVDLGKSAVGLVSGNSLGSSLVRTAIMGYAINQMSKSATAANNIDGTANIDAGVRLQIPPTTESKIPLLYGSAYFGGNITDAALTNSNKTMWYCLTLCEIQDNIRSVGYAPSYFVNNIYWNDQRIIFTSDGVTVDYTVDRSGTVDRSLSGLVKIYTYKGSSSGTANSNTAGIYPDGYSGTAFPNAYTLFPNWNGSTLMTNLLFAIVKVDYNRERNVTGLGDIKFQITNTLKKPGDVLYDYMTNTMYGAGISSSEIDLDSLDALNTYSDQSVAYDDQGTGAQTLADRYQINGLIDTAQPVMTNIEKICNACASWLSYDVSVGKWGIIINKAGTSVASFNDSNILGNISVSGTGLQDLYNEVKVQFPHRDLNDSADFVNIALNSTFLNANEAPNTLNLTYDIINEPVQAQLLGFIELKQSRIDLIIRFQTDFGKINLKAGDLIDVTNSRFGFSSKVFRIITISEVQNDDGALTMDITALEYQSDVYSTSDLYRYTRTNVNGILTIGSIGTPGTPTVTKYEVDARPRINVQSNSPTGVVEGLEYWLTNDVSSDEANRSYKLIATVRPPGGGIFTSGTGVLLDYDSLNASNFLIKTRGFNATTVGPFSTPSGLVEFAPTQVTNAIGPNTGVLDSTGGLITGLVATNLLSKVFDLFGTDYTKSLFTKIFDAFKDLTGIDLVGEASADTLVIAAQVAVRDSAGATITLPTDSLNFTSNAFNIGGTGNAATISIAPKRLWDIDGEDWTTASSTTEEVDVQGVGIERFTSITFARPNGDEITLNITWP